MGLIVYLFSPVHLIPRVVTIKELIMNKGIRGWGNCSMSVKGNMKYKNGLIFFKIYLHLWYVYNSCSNPWTRCYYHFILKRLRLLCLSLYWEGKAADIYLHVAAVIACHRAILPAGKAGKVSWCSEWRALRRLRWLLGPPIMFVIICDC